MINPKKLINTFRNVGITQYVGVPDSVLKHFLSIIPEKKNFISNNEGSAVAYGIGHYLSTKKIPLIYMQNSGLGNAINPLISIAHEKVYSIPLLLLIGWRGSPNSNDEPQHQAQGEVTKNILKLLGIKFIIINQDNDLSKIKDLINHSKKNKKPVAILIKNNKFSKVIKIKKIRKKKSNIKRILFLENLLQNIGKKDKIISTTGYTSRELYQIRLNKKLNRGKDFYMVGGMGHASNVALGISKNCKNKIIILDGDGSLLMHLGSLVNCGAISEKNFKYILLNNYTHESVGSQKTLIDKVNLKFLSKAIGFEKYLEIKKKNDINKKIKFFLKTNKKTFLNVKIEEGSIPGLLRPKKFIKIKEIFMNND
jgi:phosphonopyruvate decarboxylase